MAGHLLTFTLGKWETIPLETGKEIFIGEEQDPVKITDISDQFYAKESGMKDRIFQTIVTVETSKEKIFNLKYVKPVVLEGKKLFIDKIKKKRKKDIKEREAKVLISEDKETCNKAHVYVKKKKTPETGKLLLLIVTDPGLIFIIAGLSLILCLMLWYFFVQTTYRKNRTL